MPVIVAFYFLLLSPYRHARPSENFWTYVVVGYALANLLTIALYMADKALAGGRNTEIDDEGHRRSRLSEGGLLFSEWLGGALVAFPLRAILRHKIRSPWFNFATTVFLLTHAMFWLLWWRVQRLPADDLLPAVTSYLHLLMIVCALPAAALCKNKGVDGANAVMGYLGLTAIIVIISLGAMINPIPCLWGEVPREWTRAWQSEHSLIPDFGGFETPPSEEGSPD